jgi:hypothetical protein
MTAVRSDTGIEACRSKPMNALGLEEGANEAVWNLLVRRTRAFDRGGVEVLSPGLRFWTKSNACTYRCIIIRMCLDRSEP